ncbi:Gfo/Idh/MocA family protein [Cohnella silvisoli]|uniref:Gfo/Idh/MocA family oxidoreductase n=1 Tax=Cohnella silvisoli TaxID=2873699 RepID=A0ABV1KKY6_9BACL|nr:Gfo/Idh/MocA family oxidoreductase [Cohnella silvisoli]MCD9020852.1 Gfo/Idh/MocA family oxidoreductase [Cohnella silvisoli]
MKTNKTIQIALVGCGGMAEITRMAYRQIPNAKLSLLIDINEAVCRQAAEEMGVEHWSTKFEDALAQHIDIVDISTPNHFHASQAVSALNAGKHVLIQKPLAPTVEEAELIVQAAKKNGLQAGMYMSFFDNPLFYEANAIITQGKLGEISSVRCRAATNNETFVRPGNWRNSAEKTGGGALIQLALHPLNMVQWLVDSPVERVMAFSHNRHSPLIGGDDVTVATCYYANGILGSVEASYCSHHFTLSIYGTKGFLTITENTRVELMLGEAHEGEYIRCEKPGQVMNLEFPQLTMTHIQVEPNPYNQHAAFVRAIQNGESAPVSAETGLRDLKIVQAIYRSAREQRIVDVNEQ